MKLCTRIHIRCLVIVTLRILRLRCQNGVLIWKGCVTFEFGGNLRAVVLDADGFHPVMVRKHSI